MPDVALAGFVKETAEGLGVTGAAVGVWANGREVFASHGVTSVENPLPVRPDTLFLIASVTKTFTATAVMRLLADGKVALDAPVRRYVPELVLADERAADQITVLNLLNHTSGLDWGASAASSPATQAARSPASTWPGGWPAASSETGGAGWAGREGQGGQVSWTQAPVTRRRASWAGVTGSWQRAQGTLAERAVLASEPSGGSPAGPRPIGPESVTGRPTPPGQK
jgi:Beta-lactamase